MKGKNKSINNIQDIDTNQIKFSKYIRKIEPTISKLLYIISFVIFLFKSLLFIPNSSLNYLFNLGFWIFIILAAFFIIPPIFYYLDINKKISPELVKSYEMLGTLILILGSILNQFVPDITICAISLLGSPCSTYPGSFLVGLIVSSFFIGLIKLIIPKVDLRLPSSKQFSTKEFKIIKNILEARISAIYNDIKENKNIINKKFQRLQDSQNWELSDYILKLLRKNIKLHEEYFFRKKQLIYFDKDPKIMLKMAEIAYYEKNYEEGIILCKKAIDQVNDLEFRHLLALNLAKIQHYQEAFEIFLDLLKNLNYKRLINYEVLSLVLENIGKNNAKKAANEKNYHLLLEKLGLNEVNRQFKKFKINIILAFILVVIMILISIYIIFP